MELDGLFRLIGALRYRLGRGFQFSDVPDRSLVRIVDGGGTAGRALDIGCGTGRNALYLAAHGWQAVGVDMVARAVDVAAAKARDTGSTARFVRGDVTRLPELGLGPAFDLLNDSGCFHTIPESQHHAYAESVTAVAAPGAQLMVTGVDRRLGSPEEFAVLLPGWSLQDSERVPGAEMATYIGGRGVFRSALRSERFTVLRYTLTRNP